MGGMSGIAGIIAGVGEAMHEDRRNKQKMEEARIERIRETLKDISNDEFLPPEEVNKWNNLRFKIDQTGKIDKEVEQALPVLMADYQDSLKKRARAGQSQAMQVPPPPATTPGLAPQEQSVEVPPPPGVQAASAPEQTFSPFPAGSRADMKWRSQLAQRTAIERMQQAAEEAKAKRARERAADVSGRLQRGEITPDQANIELGERLIIPPPPTQTPRPFVVGKSLVSPEGKVIYTASEKEDLDPNLAFERHEDSNSGNVTVIGRNPKTGEEKFRTVEKGVSRNRPPSMLINVGGMNNAQFQRMRQLDTGLRQEKPVQMFNEVFSGVNTIREAATRGDGIGDITLMRTFAKITDPATGVREEEYRTMEGAQGALQQLQAFLTPGKWTEGQRLTPAARQAFLRMSERILEGRRRQANQIVNRYRSQAKQAGVDESLITLENVVTPPAEAAPSGTVPVVGEMFQGQRIKSVKKIK